MIDAVVSITLVGFLMIAALQTIGSATLRQRSTFDQALAQHLATEMMQEILLHAYVDPEAEQPNAFGPESDETSGNRAPFDDVDDFDGWDATPPQAISGVVLEGFDGWRRRVDVVWADRDSLQPTTDELTGLKQIVVSIYHRDRLVKSLVGYRSIGWVDTIPSPSGAMGNHPPVAVATSPDLSQHVGAAVEFYGDQSSDQDGDYLSHVWDFGDGTQGAGASIEHLYNTPGNFTCTLTVYDGKGGVATSTLIAVIEP
jgi:type II secretory pathway pseudopilin PulG